MTSPRIHGGHCNHTFTDPPLLLCDLQMAITASGCGQSQGSHRQGLKLLESSVEMVREVFGLMKHADWVHFSCHGVRDSDNSGNSGLCVADERRLGLSDVILLPRPHGGLSLPSARQAAMDDKELSDEAIHTIPEV